MNRNELAVAVGVLAVGVLLAVGATGIRGEAVYSGVGPGFLPWVVAVALLAGGALLAWEAATGGFREMDAPPGAERGHWPGFAWVSAGVLANAALITRIGFILACVVCFVLAVRGFVSAEGRRDRPLAAVAVDALIGFAIAAPVYWMFTKALGISLPGLTDTGWI